MKNIYLIILFAILLIIPSISAFEFDNSKIYDRASETITIKNAFGLGDTLMSIQLVENTDNCAGDCYAIFKITNYNKIDLGNTYDNTFKWEFEDLLNSRAKKEITHGFEMALTNKTILLGYQTVCNPTGEITPNKTEMQLCHPEEVYKSVPDYKSFNYKGNNLPIGEYYFKLKGSKGEKEIIDWIPSLIGVELSEWYVWGTSTVRIENMTQAGGTGMPLSYGGTYQIKQSFTIGNQTTNQRYNITKVGIYIHDKDGTPDDIGWLFFHDVGGAYPTTKNGSAFASTENISAGSITAEKWYNFTVSTGTAVVNASTKYLIEQIINTGNGANLYSTNVSNSYDGGNCYGNGAANCDGANNDMLFILYGLAENPRNINMTYPETKSYNASSSPVALNYTSLNWQRCWYSKNGGATNSSTVACGINWTGLTASIGSNTWTVYGNDTENHIESDSNTFTVTLFTENSQTYNASTMEGTTNIYKINLTIDNYPTYQLGTCNLSYNGTSYDGTISHIGNGEYIVTKSLSAPTVTADTNYSFYWSITTSDGNLFNSTFKNQTVNDTGKMDNCTAYSFVLLNLTLKDEEFQTLLNGTIEVDLDIYAPFSSSSLINYSRSFVGYNNTAICLEKNLSAGSYSLDTILRYSSIGYSPEYYHIQNYTITLGTFPINITLFDLNSSDSTPFLITYKDENYLPVSDALIDITRQYVSDGIFKTVEIPKTDANGQTTGHFDTDSVTYTILVKKNGQILSTFENIAVVCEDSVIKDCKINLNALSTTTPITDFINYKNLTYTITFNEITRVITTLFTSDGSATVRVNATKFDMFQNISVCSDSLTSSSGTLTCSIPASYGNVTVIYELYKDNDLITTRTFTISPDIVEMFGDLRIIMLVILMMTIPLMFVTSTIGIIIGAFLGLIMASLLMIYKGGSFFGASSAIIWLVISGGIIAWRIMQRER